MDNVEIKKEIDFLFQKLAESAATFIYKPDELKKIRQNIYSLQDKCEHKFINGKCIYCRKDEHVN